MKVAPFLGAEIVPFVICDEVYDSAVRQRRRFVENQSPLLDASTQGTHATTVRRSPRLSKSIDWHECFRGWTLADPPAVLPFSDETAAVP
jgi:hypothetical protein